MLLTNTDLNFLTDLIILLYLKLLKMLATLVTFSMQGIKHQRINSLISLKVAPNILYISYIVLYIIYIIINIRHRNLRRSDC